MGQLQNRLQIGGIFPAIVTASFFVQAARKAPSEGKQDSDCKELSVYFQHRREGKAAKAMAVKMVRMMMIVCATYEAKAVKRKEKELEEPDSNPQNEEQQNAVPA